MIESHGILILDRKDLALESREKDIKDIRPTDIAVSNKPFCRAELVIFKDEHKMRVLKSRYPIEI